MPEEREPGRKLRPKEHKVYMDDVDDEEIEGGNKREFSLEEKLKSPKFSNMKMLKVMNGHEVNVKYFQENGFKYPIVVKQKDGLGIRIPGENFTVTDVKQCVGSRRQVDVMDVNTQKGEVMTMKEWVRYYQDPEHDRLLNVISLEFSHTRLENYVEQPTVVKQMDWVETAWPVFHKESQTETTNIIEKMKYPKVQKYVLMSVAGCYTDFHIDMGGTSVWYHILHGEKIFWLAPPTVENLDIFEKWIKSGRQGDIFLGDKINDCMRVKLEKGYTFFIPTGWIHAVYTPKDSLVFGGNFLHSINIDMQLSVWDIESRTHVPFKFRYPFFTEIHWYVLDRYLSCVWGKSHRVKSAEELKADKEEEEDEAKEEAERSEVKAEDDASIDYTPPRTPVEDDASSVTSTRGSRSHCGRPGTPHSLTEDNSRPGTPDSRASSTRRGRGGAKSKSLGGTDLDRIRPVSVKLENCMLVDRSKLMGRGDGAVSGEKKPWVHLTKYELEGLRQIVEWCEGLPPTKKLVPKDIADPDGLLADMKLMIKDHMGDNPQESLTGDLAIKWPLRKKAKVKVRTYTTSFPRPKHPKVARPPGASSIRRRRVRCKKCEPCTRSNCEMCTFCKDMKKYGGPGTMKQSCISRQCIRPELPSSIICMICSKPDSADPGEDELPLDTLLECAICFEIVHPRCHREKNSALTTDGILNEDLPNSWECAKCVDEGRHGCARPRQIKGTRKEHEEFHTAVVSLPKPKTSPSSSVGDSDAENRKGAINKVGRPGSRRTQSWGSTKTESVKATVPCNGSHMNGSDDDTSKNTTKRKHRSLWDDFDMPSPPTKILKIELSPLKGYPLPGLTSPKIRADLTLEEDSPVLKDIDKSQNEDSKTLQNPQTEEVKTLEKSRSHSSSPHTLPPNKHEELPDKPARRRSSSSSPVKPRRSIPALTRSRRNSSPTKRYMEYAATNGLPLSVGRRDPSPLKSPTNRSTSPLKSPSSASSSSPKLTSRGREINLPSRFLR